MSFPKVIYSHRYLGFTLKSNQCSLHMIDFSNLIAFLMSLKSQFFNAIKLFLGKQYLHRHSLWTKFKFEFSYIVYANKNCLGTKGSNIQNKHRYK